MKRFIATKFKPSSSSLHLPIQRSDSLVSRESSSSFYSGMNRNNNNHWKPSDDDHLRHFYHSEKEEDTIGMYHQHPATTLENHPGHNHTNLESHHHYYLNDTDHQSVLSTTSTHDGLLQKKNRHGGFFDKYKKNGFRQTIFSILSTQPKVEEINHDDHRHSSFLPVTTIMTEKEVIQPTKPSPVYSPPERQPHVKNIKNASYPLWINDSRMNHQHNTRPHRHWLPFFSYLFAMATCILLIYEIIQFKQNYGTIINLSPFNIMLGPNSKIFIRSGALFTPCMRSSQSISSSAVYKCPSDNGQPSTLSAPSWSYSFNDGNDDDGIQCSLKDMCGLSSFDQNSDQPYQPYRFITAIAVHGGIIQWLVNIAILLTFGATIERRVNPIRFMLVWTLSGTFGYVLASVFVHDDIVLMGCLGSLNGIFGLALVNHIQTWQMTPQSSIHFFKLLLLIVLSAALGYLPGYNNFCHLGGFMAGILSGIVVIPTKWTFRFNKKYWIMMMFIRLLALVALGVLFYLLLSKFYSNQNMLDDCSWCGYMTCLPIFNMCKGH
ncbi:uncharacterized protein BX664DRAFT_371512 [Halteromyces radiatus]|uniref:uncharacterized protein n=1 Tax=Halteromyces radiatus TaxID=101107 RepID=UPI00221F0073|nr:uncharacterized protein BX664DRAFT_371512 [Halteromyces radiatus]KAI8092678.1 hypothetical protein BX664DRAFT_371512 [Halteromyces radiatus]